MPITSDCAECGRLGPHLLVVTVVSRDYEQGALLVLCPTCLDELEAKLSREG